MTFHMESMDRSVEYRQDQVAHDIAAARNSMFWTGVRVGAGAFLVRIGERLGRESACLEQAVQAPRRRTARPLAA